MGNQRQNEKLFTIQNHNMKSIKNIHFIALSAALGGLLFGYDTAVISGAIGNLTTYFQLSPIETGWAISSALVGCLIGAFFSDSISSFLGRKKTMFAAGILFFTCALGTALPESFNVFIWFRIIGGIGVGLASMVVPMYIAEIAPAEKRGSLVAYNQLAIVTGIVLVYFINYYIALQGDVEWNLNHGWRWMFGSGTIPAALYLLVVLWLPESPRWYIQKNKSAEALTVLQNLNSKDTAWTILKEIKESVSEKKQNQFQLLLQPHFKKALLVGIGLSVFQQITGINAILYYAPEIFKNFGSDTNASLLETSLLGVINLIFTIIAIYWVDKVGRKPLLLIGSLGMFSALTVVGVSAYFQISDSWLLPFLLLFMASFSISWGPVVWVLLSEIFPNTVRSFALSIAVFIQWIANFAVSQTFPMMTENTWLKSHFNNAFPFLLFALLCLVAMGFTWKFVPETKNKKLEEMDELWDNQ
jgi:SP family xylose:H+ symportor-like MFS transporter